MVLKCDLHIHSCLSPCGSLSMSPSAIARIASEKGLDVIAIADHNIALNAPAFEAACRKYGITSLFGVEVTTSEEFHALCLFQKSGEAVSFGNMLYENLQSRSNKPEKFGDQVYVDEYENILGEVDKYLSGGAVSYSSDQLLKMVHLSNGLFIPAHIDRAAFSISSQLGFIPPDDYDALEITTYPPILNTENTPLISNSDAHYPDDIGKRYFFLECNSRKPEHIFKAIKEGKTTPSIKKITK
ncbi:MAG: PHP domain-containing protein [Spirochaetaceae bacterium]|jgi:PHP family Zn ribbon phosphoesterase|nr:PHP domain-containing protein [Spirochaetaceae bacterium]